jgi:transcriptional regulator with XRE-family HTH domain
MDPTQRAARGYVQAVLEHTRWSATELARRCKLAPSTLNRFLHSERITHTLSARTLAKIAQASGLPLPASLGAGPGDYGDHPAPAPGPKLSLVASPLAAPPPGPVANSRPGVFLGGRDLPVRGHAQGGPDGAVLLDPDPIDWTFRPAELQGARDAFAMFVTGASMGEILPEGTTIFVHPSLPPRPNDFVVVEKTGHEALIKRLIRRTAEHLWLRQYNPPKDIRLERSQVLALYRVIGAIYP